jgi:hypothetical protein
LSRVATGVMPMGWFWPEFAGSFRRLVEVMQWFVVFQRLQPCTSCGVPLPPLQIKPDASGSVVVMWISALVFLVGLRGCGQRGWWGRILLRSTGRGSGDVVFFERSSAVDLRRRVAPCRCFFWSKGDPLKDLAGSVFSPASRRPWAGLPTTSMAEGRLLPSSKLAIARWCKVFFNLQAMPWRPFSSSAIGSRRRDPSGHVPGVVVVDRGWKLGELGGDGAGLIAFSSFRSRVLCVNL